MGAAEKLNIDLEEAKKIKVKELKAKSAKDLERKLERLNERFANKESRVIQEIVLKAKIKDLSERVVEVKASLKSSREELRALRRRGRKAKSA